MERKLFHLFYLADYFRRAPLGGASQEFLLTWGRGDAETRRRTNEQQIFNQHQWLSSAFSLEFNQLEIFT
ncbi:MAG: hypothetical protein F6J96_21035 [Symploca sp. SIO1C2]|nr:hypothetical protein [Symploca sp. SIO1C2]